MYDNLISSDGHDIIKKKKKKRTHNNIRNSNGHKSSRTSAPMFSVSLVSPVSLSTLIINSLEDYVLPDPYSHST